jgi:hypothetical protein
MPFVDIGFFNPEGIQIGYAGPYPHLRDKDYSREEWYRDLISSPKAISSPIFISGCGGNPISPSA